MRADVAGAWRRWSGGLDPSMQAAGEGAFWREAEGVVRRIRRDCLGLGCVYLAYWLAVMVAPSGPWIRLAAGWLSAVWPGVFAPPGAPAAVLEEQNVVTAAAVFLVIAAGVAVARAVAERATLRAGYAAADARVGGMFVRGPGRASQVGVALLVGWLAGPGWLGLAVWASAGWAMRAGLDDGLRLVVSPGRRVRDAGALLAREVRSGPFLAAAGIGLLVAVFGPGARREAGQTPGWDQARVVRADARVMAADAAAERAYAAALPASAAPSELVRLHLLWGTGALFRTSVADALAADAEFEAALGRVNAAWDGVRARRFTDAALREKCGTGGAGPACRVVETGVVAGSDGTLAYRLTAPAGELLDGTAGAMRTDAAEVFERDEGGGWRLAVHAGFEDATPGAPRVTRPREGALLVVPARTGGLSRMDGEASQVFVRAGGSWRWVDTTGWLAEASARLPAHACLLQTMYGVEGQPMYSDIAPNYDTLTATGLFGPDPADLGSARGRFEATLGVENGTLVVRQEAVTPLPDRRGWLRRLFGRARRC